MRQRKGESREDFNARRRVYRQRSKWAETRRMVEAESAGKWEETRRTLNAEGSVTSTVEKRARGPETVVKIPAAAISRTSTLYDADGNVAQQWVQEKPEERAKVELWETIAKGLADSLPRVKPTEIDCPIFMKDLCTLYPIGDQHKGMLAWKHETGASWDLDISERLLTGAFSYLAAAAPPTETALIAVLGDYFHYDSLEPVTPTSRNILDADGRFPKMVMAGVRTIRRAIDVALTRHKTVRVIIEIGNHDLSTSIFLAIALHNIFENEPRVSVDISPKHFHYFVYGGNLIGTHHGHGRKPEELPLVMALDQPEAWASCPFRMWMTGHVHKQQQWSIQGVRVESFRILAPSDAWAANKGYRSERGMDAIVLRRRGGIHSRFSVTPDMLEQGV